MSPARPRSRGSGRIWFGSARGCRRHAAGDQGKAGQVLATLNDALLDLVKRGVVAPEEALLRAADKAGLAAQLKLLEAPVAV